MPHKRYHSSCSNNTHTTFYYLVGIGSVNEIEHYSRFLTTFQRSGKSGFGFWGIVTTEVGMNNSILIHGIAIFRRRRANATGTIWIGYLQKEVAVIGSAPSPIDMEKVFTVVAIDNKSMSSSRRLSTIDNRSVTDELLINQFLP